ncbi:MAG: sulfide/dihydroorotate dehydrogenase-like FAD/NAD-binding protein [Candidatus Omnitrophica bacterium]|nr:sulfide/dihydroorotate dehydrogenase-like FAD/NAD-binding protein [Candidatus Omnitrophota bacterium]
MKILNKKILADVANIKITMLEISAPNIADKAKAGQFVVLMVSEKGERIPLTVVDTDSSKGSITLIFQELGFTTRLLGKMNVGNDLYAITGPLGHPTEIKNYGKIILVGGGVGIAEIYPVAKAMKNSGNYIITILGARAKDLLILESELKSVSDEVHIATDDGSYGKKGFTTDILKDILSGSQSPRVSLVYIVGPIPMMKKVSAITKDFNIKAVASLNALMVDATGMCGCCRVTVKGEVKFSCVDGPEFDVDDVNWEELEKRSKIYIDKEKHICQLNKL